jgi:hypothetical protein
MVVIISRSVYRMIEDHIKVHPKGVVKIDVFEWSEKRFINFNRDV